MPKKLHPYWVSVEMLEMEVTIEVNCEHSLKNDSGRYYTGCLLISVACLGIYNLLIFWSLRAEILSTLISKVYKLIDMKEQIKKLFNHH